MGDSRGEASPAAKERGPLLGDYTDDASGLAGAEDDAALSLGEERIVGTYADIDTRDENECPADAR